MKKSIINSLKQNKIFSEIDIHFAQFIGSIANCRDSDVFLAAALTSRANQNGNICLDLNAMSGRTITEPNADQDAIVCPKLKTWLQKLLDHPAVGRPGDKCPLILDAFNRLYLYRYWEYEKKIGAFIRNRSGQTIPDLDLTQLKHSLRKHFPQEPHQAINWQKIAAAAAVLKPFSVITGGPGTGKTFTIAKILAILLEQTGASGLDIQLAAPTGKAASRLNESIQQALVKLNCSDGTKQAIACEVSTIHRMLKPIPGSPYFHYTADNQLRADIVVIDEASMVDLALMSKLVQATPSTARLVLIGDRDQLASVEAGSVLGDICDRSHLHDFSDDFCRTILALTNEDLSGSVKNTDLQPGLQDCIVVLQKSHRFPAESGIGALSHAIKSGQSDRAFTILADPNDISMVWSEIEDAKDFTNNLAKEINHGYSKYLKTSDPVQALEDFNRFKILCAVKIGPLGVDAINQLAEKTLRQHNLIQFDPKRHQPWYRGRPILITRNDYNLGLFNGDIGITLPDPKQAGHELYVYFPGYGGEIRRFAPQQLPAHQTVYAMTVHKSQGSEFDEVVLVLPDRFNPVLTRELVYTGLTRTRSKISIWANRAILRQAILAKMERTSGLREALWQ